MVKTTDKDMTQFQDDLLASVPQMKAGKAVRATALALTPTAEARAKVGVSQSAFAVLLGVPSSAGRRVGGSAGRRAIW